MTVSARAAGSTIVIEVGDDGYGIDEDALRSRRHRARHVAGRQSDVGTAALRDALPARLQHPRRKFRRPQVEGSASTSCALPSKNWVARSRSRASLGVGTTFIMTLPVTLGVMRCLVARLGDERYAVPVTNVTETISLTDAETTTVAGASVLVRHGSTVPLADLGRALGVPGERETRVGVVVRYGGAIGAACLGRGCTRRRA